MGGYTGGAPDTISAGATQLKTVARAVGSAAPVITRAGSAGSAAAVTQPLAGAIERFAAAFSRTTADVEIELEAASTLAANAAADLQIAGGGPGGPR